MQKQPTTKRTGMMSVLGRSPLVHKVVGVLGVYRLANGFLKRLPIVRRIGGKPVFVRINSVAALALAEELLGDAGYKPALNGYPVRHFIDLGCNVGWFPCLLASLQFPEKPIGLMIDGDPLVVEAAEWHLAKNRLMDCRVLHGAVGCPDGLEEVTFHINPSNTQSSIREFGSNHPFPLKGSVRQVSVPCLTVSEEWTRRYGSQCIDLLKIDIEGAELDFLKKESAFLCAQVRRVVCEWHAWHVTLAEIREFMESRDFRLHSVIEEDEKGGVVVFDNLKQIGAP
jgi:FkbM family methyltransferase